MTLEEFLDKLEQTPRRWLVDDLNCIRLRAPTRYCPLYAVPGAHAELPGDVRAAVVCAADNCGDRQLRAQLLQRTGLVEPEHQP